MIPNLQIYIASYVYLQKNYQLNRYQKEYQTITIDNKEAKKTIIELETKVKNAVEVSAGYQRQATELEDAASKKKKKAEEYVQLFTSSIHRACIMLYVVHLTNVSVLLFHRAKQAKQKKAAEKKKKAAEKKKKAAEDKEKQRKKKKQ